MLWNTAKVDVNHKARNGQTPLLLALERRDEALAHYLLKKPGLSLGSNTEDNQGRTPSLIAVQNGRRDTARLLLEAGVSPNLADDQGRTPLSSALSHGKLMVQLLLSYGAEVNEIDSLDQGLLNKAVIYHCEEVISTLLEFGADINLRDARDCTALGIAIDDGYHSAIRHLIADKHVDLNTLSGGYPPLTLAIMNDQITTVRLLCAISKLDPNQLDHDAQTPLNAAIMHHNMDIMDILPQRRDVSLRMIGPNTESPLCMAVNSDNRHAVQRLLQCNGINVNDGSLLRAIRIASINIVEDLLEAGCDVDVRNECGTSAAMEAAKLGLTDILGHLSNSAKSTSTLKTRRDGQLCGGQRIEKKKPRLSSYFRTGGFPPTDSTMGLASPSTSSGLRLYIPWCEVPR
ncbi:ankyrin repeat-containing domain protein [Aspergillus aurantiobrunneus]